VQHSPPEPDYDSMTYRRAGRSGIVLPAISLGLWHNFGDVDDYATAREIVRRAWELGVTHFDLANNYGPPPGAAERTFGRILRDDFAGRRDRMIITSKAGYRMWDGPYQDGGSRKYLVSSLDRSLERLGVEYVDVFYHHRPDPDTPLEETMRALDQVVRQGKALYAGLSNYGADETRKALDILDSLGTPRLLHQPRYSMFDRRVESGLLDVIDEAGLGCVVYSPLAQGLLTDRYLDGIPTDSRAASEHGFLARESITAERVRTVRRLADIAADRGQSIAGMALSWVLRHPQVTSALVGVSGVEQLEQNVAALDRLGFSADEARAIDHILDDDG
jgi:L-glyceraldehyde 3-phosphate reductase